MVDQRLVAYVQQQRQAGFSDEQIAEALHQQGYPESLIQTLLTASVEPGPQPKGLLEGYVRTYQQQGYTDAQIRAGLQQQGFIVSDIDRAIRHVSMRAPAPKVHTKALLLFPIIAIILLGGGYYLFIYDTTIESPPIVAPPTSEGPVRLAEILDNLIPLAGKNPDAALKLCESIADEDIPVCIFTVSQEARNPALCAQIEHDWTRDQCYMEFIYDDHLEYCNRLTLEENIRFCDNLRRFEVASA